MAENNKSMIQSLRELDLNEKKTFVLERRDSVLTTIQRLKYKGYRFECNTFIDDGCVVTKIKNPK